MFAYFKEFDKKTVGESARDEVRVLWRFLSASELVDGNELELKQSLRCCPYLAD